MMKYDRPWGPSTATSTLPESLPWLAMSNSWGCSGKTSVMLLPMIVSREIATSLHALPLAWVTAPRWLTDITASEIDPSNESSRDSERLFSMSALRCLSLFSMASAAEITIPRVWRWALWDLPERVMAPSKSPSGENTGAEQQVQRWWSWL